MCLDSPNTLRHIAMTRAAQPSQPIALVVSLPDGDATINIEAGATHQVGTEYIGAVFHGSPLSQTARLAVPGDDVRQFMSCKTANSSAFCAKSTRLVLRATLLPSLYAVSPFPVLRMNRVTQAVSP